MAALPYMQLYVADYLADTMHLDAEEHGAYLLLLFNHWQTGKPIPKSRLAKIARVSNDRWPSVERSLEEFFNDNGTEWSHKRIEADLEMAREAQAQRIAAGRASAEARKREKGTKLKRESSDRSTTVATPVENPLNENATNKEQNRTEQNKDKPLVVPLADGKRHSTQPKGSPLPADWTPPDDLMAWTASETGWGAQRILVVANKFRDYWIAVPGARGRKADWDATWRNWVRREAEGSNENSVRNPQRSSEQGLSVAERVALANGLNRDGSSRSIN